MLNKVQIIGRVGKDPEARTFNNGGKLVNMNVATTERWIKDGEKKESTEWHNVVVRGKACDFVEKYVKKGDLLYLEGKLVTEEWNDKDGNKRFTTKINCFVVQSLQTKERTQQNEGKAPQNASPEPVKDDLPF